MRTGKQARKSVRKKIVPALIVVCGALLFNQIGHSSTQRPGVNMATEGKPLADFFLPDLAGSVWILEEHRGKVVWHPLNITLNVQIESDCAGDRCKGVESGTIEATRQYTGIM